MRASVHIRGILFSALCALLAACSGVINGPDTFGILTISPASADLALGLTLQLHARLRDQDVSDLATWSLISQGGQATVNNHGLVSSAGGQLGKVRVSAEWQGQSADAEITIGPPVLVSLAFSGPLFVAVGSTQALTVTGTFSDNSTQNFSTTAAYSSTDGTIATVNTSGVANGASAGAVTINASVGGVSAGTTFIVAPLVTWTGATGDGLWSTAGNWLDLAVPGAGDVVTFDAICGSHCAATVDTAVSVAGVALTSRFTGSVTQGATRTITVGAGGWSQAGGSFLGSGAAITINTALQITGGTFQSTSGTLTIHATDFVANNTFFTLGAGGDFVAHGGTVQVTGGNDGCGTPPTNHFSLAKPVTFNNLNANTFAGCGSVGYIDIPNGQTVNVTGTLTHSSDQIYGAIHLTGNLIVGASALGGAGPITFEAAGAQTYAQAAGGIAAGLRVETGSSVSAAGGTTVLGTSTLFVNGGAFQAPTGTLTITSPAGFNQIALGTASGGTFDANGGKVTFTGGSPTCTGSIQDSIAAAQPITFYQLEMAQFDGCGEFSELLTGSSSVTVTNTLIHTSGLFSGTLDLLGNLSVGAAATGGAGTIRFSGTSPQTYSVTGAGVTAGLTILNATGVTPAGGTTALASGIFTLSTGSFQAPSGTWAISPPFYNSATIFTYAAGTTFDANSGTIKILGSAGCGITTALGIALGQSLVWNNLILDIAEVCGSTGEFSVPTGASTLTVAGNLTQTHGTAEGPLYLQGNLSSAYATYTGYGTITFNGTGAQTWTQASPGQGSRGAFIVDKPSGTLTLASTITLPEPGQSLTIHRGQLDLSSFALTVPGTLQIDAAGTLKLSTGSHSEGTLINNGAIVP